MPIYEYRCGSCATELEKLQKISDPPLLECPECGRDTLVKLISASSFRLKGSGWYETDFKTGNKKHGAAEAPSEGTGSAEAAATATPESTNAGSQSGANDAGKDGQGKEQGKEQGREKSKEQKTSESKPEAKPDKKPEPKSTASGAGTLNKPATKP